MLPTNAQERKDTPIATGVLDYFPDALAEIARVSLAGGKQHNPGQPLHWDKSKSTDHADCLMRHFMERGTRDTDGMRHSAKAAWRVLALLQTELETELESERHGMVDSGTDSKQHDYVSGIYEPIDAGQLDFGFTLYTATDSDSPMGSVV